MSSRRYESERKNYTMEELASLGKRSAEGDLAARNELVLSHMYLVEQILPQFRGKGVDADDLFQEGCYGLIEAVDRYDYTKGIRLSTYAAHWIRKRMGLALISQNMKSPINIPSDKIYYALRRYTRCRFDLTEAYGRPPTTEEIAAELNVPVKKVVDINRYIFSFNSLDIDKRTDGSSRPQFTPKACCVPSAEDEAFSLVFRTELPVPAANLTPRQREILSRRCGFTPSGEPQTIEAVSAALHISTETVRTDYNAALNKLRKAFKENPEQF